MEDKEKKFEFFNFGDGFHDKDFNLPKPKHHLKSFLKGFFRLLFFSILIISVASISIGYIYYLKIKNDFYFAKPRVNATQLVLYDKNKEIIYESYGTRAPEPVKLKDLPESMVQATLAAEDVDFYKHEAFDSKAILRALYEGYQRGSEEGNSITALLSVSSYSQGGSTITQQLVKNRYLTTERSFNRKLKELVFASEMEKRYSKDEILEMYLNEIYYGEQALGVENAARIYFGKKAKDLNLAEASMLAGLPQAPTKYSPSSGDFLESKNRQEYVLQQMYAAKFITLEKAKEAANETLLLVGKNNFVNKYPFFSDWVISELTTKFGEDFVKEGGVKVYTTLDPNFQRISEEAVMKNLKAFTSRKVTNASVVVLEPKTSEVRAMVGGSDYEKSKVNVATSERQPGSSFKPFVYLTGLENKFTANSKFMDKSVNFGGNPGYIPRNYDGGFRGLVTMRQSLAWSLNIPAVEMLSLAGMDKVIELGKNVGIRIDEEAKRCGLSLALGCKEVRLLDLTGAYGVVADGGNYAKPIGFTKVLDNKDDLIFENKLKKKGVVSKENAYILTNILSDINTRRTVFGFKNKLELDRPVAAKTGTTDNFTDSWTMGFTPDVVVGVWMGNNDRTPMVKNSGIEGAAYIWNDVMMAINKGVEIKNFERPEGVEEVRINPTTGELVQRGGILEVFKTGTVPVGKQDNSYLSRF